MIVLLVMCVVVLIGLFFVIYLFEYVSLLFWGWVKLIFELFVGILIVVYGFFVVMLIVFLVWDFV